MDNTPDLGKAVSSFTKLQGLGRNVAGFPRPHTTQPVSLGLTASLPFLGSTPDFVSPGTGQGLRGICRRHQTRRGSEKPGQRQRTGEETQPGSLAPPPGWDREGLYREQEEVQRPGPVQDTHPRAPCSLPLCAHFSIERIFTVTTSQRVSSFQTTSTWKQSQRLFSSPEPLPPAPPSSSASHLLINPDQACGLPSAS